MNLPLLFSIAKSLLLARWKQTLVAAVGVTAGASAPEVLVKQVVEQLTAWGGKQVIEHPGREENVVCAVPAELR